MQGTWDCLDIMSERVYQNNPMCGGKADRFDGAVSHGGVLQSQISDTFSRRHMSILRLYFFPTICTQKCSGD